MTTHGSTPNKSKWVIPPIWNPCPLIEDKPSFSHTALQQDRNHEHCIGDHCPSAILNMNRGADSGIATFEERWCSRAVVALQGHVESVTLTSSPFSLVLVFGKWKFMYFRLLVAMPCLIMVEWETWDVGSKDELMRSSSNLLTHK